MNRKQIDHQIRVLQRRLSQYPPRRPEHSTLIHQIDQLRDKRAIAQAEGR